MTLKKCLLTIFCVLLVQQQQIESAQEKANPFLTNKQLALLAAGLVGVPLAATWAGALLLRAWVQQNIYYMHVMMREIQPFAGGQKIPIVYRDEYNFSQGGFFNTVLSYLHPFDTQKYRTIATVIQDGLNVKSTQFYIPAPVSDEDLYKIHTADYLSSLRSSSTISEIIDMGKLLSWVPNSFFQQHLLLPMKYAVGGTIEAAKLALMRYGWAINLAGGYHHAKADKGQGGCVYADIPLAIKKLRESVPDLKVMIIDLDAHHSNGIESILGNDPRVYIFDMFNRNVEPLELDLLYNNPQYWYDFVAEKFIPVDPVAKLSNVYDVPLEGGELSSELYGIPMPDVFVEHCVNRAISTYKYIETLKQELPEAYQKCVAYFNGYKPDLIIYNAGTDIHKDDSWGCMNVETEGIYARDQYIFEYAMKEKKIPIVMLPAGGYFKESGKVIGGSIVNIIRKVVMPLKYKKQN